MARARVRAIRRTSAIGALSSMSVALLLSCSAASAPTEVGTVAVTTADVGSTVSARVLEVTDRPQTVGDISAAGSRDQLVELWFTAGFTGELPTVDFGSDVVLSFGVMSGPCKVTGIRLEMTSPDAFRPVFVEDDQQCAAKGDSMAYAVGVDRSALPEVFTLTLDSADGGDGRVMRVRLNAEGLDYERLDG